MLSLPDSERLSPKLSNLLTLAGEYRLSQEKRRLEGSFREGGMSKVCDWNVRASGFTFPKVCDSSDGAELPSVINPSSAQDKQPSEAGTRYETWPQPSLASTAR